MQKLNLNSLGIVFLAAILFTACDKEKNDPVGKDISAAVKVSVDRFSSSAGKLMVRNATNGLPAANAPINFDQGPFITTGLNAAGQPISYYNFDVQSTSPAPIYVFFKQGASSPVNGQNNIINVLPGEVGYNDFWIVTKVVVPEDYVPNSLTSEAEILTSEYPLETTDIIVNCPVVPFGSTASRSKDTGKSSVLTLGWHKGQAVAYFSFEEAPLKAVNGKVPLSPIYVMFNDNAAGPASGFRAETTNPVQTHNILATQPGDASYSPLWNVFVLDNQYFEQVKNLTSASQLPNTAAGATVNCPAIR